ncbi:MAG: hypothetical protein CMM30_01685 [Rhodospirillaceae bacterium]|nr:hypothetical protein [Rhodospirillaceae bacterium]
MKDLRQTYASNSMSKICTRLTEAGYENTITENLESLWNILSKDILEQNTLFFNYKYSLFTNEILTNLLIGHNSFKSAISIRNAGMLFAALMSINASRRIGSNLIPENVNTHINNSTKDELFMWDAQMLGKFEVRVDHIIEKLRDTALVTNKQFCQDLSRGCNLFNLRVTANEEFTGLVRASLVLGVFSFPDLCSHINFVRKDICLGWPKIFNPSITNRDFSSHLLDHFWLKLYPYISDGVILLDQVKNDFLGQQLTYNLHNLEQMAGRK